MESLVMELGSIKRFDHFFLMGSRVNLSMLVCSQTKTGLPQWFFPWFCGNSYFRYPCLKNFFFKGPTTNDLEVTKAYSTLFQAAFS
jgi:hypothetical protein